MNLSKGTYARLRPIQYVAAVLVVTFPLIVYYYTILKNAYNFPYEDDLNSTLSFISDYAFGNLTPWDKLKLVFWQYNEHRIVVDRLAFLADYGVVGQLNFRHLILIGNLAPLLIGWLFWIVSFRTIPIFSKLLYLLPVAYTLFSFQYWELSTWSMAALQNLYVIPFALFSLYSLCEAKRAAFLLACGAAVLATFTSGNGLFTFVAGIGLLILLKSYRKLVLWVLVGALTIGLYFWGYVRPPYHPDIADSLVNHTGRAVGYFFTLLGSMVGPARPKLALLVGITSFLLSLGLLGYLGYQKRLIAYLPLISWLAFLYLTCLSLMASRSGMGIEQAFTPRYGIVVVTLFATQAVLALEVSQFQHIRLTVLSIYVVFSLYFYFSITNRSNRHRIEDRTRQMRYNSALYYADHGNIALHWGNQRVAKAIFTDAIRKKIYQVPHVTFSDLAAPPLPFDAAHLRDTPTVTSNINPYPIDNFLVIYRAWALLNGESSRNQTVQLIVRSATNCYAFTTQKHTWDDPGDYTFGKHYTQPGFSCVLDKKGLQPGHYSVWISLQEGDTRVYHLIPFTFDN